MSGPRLPVVEGGYIYGGGATIGGMSKGMGGAGGATAEEVEGGKVTGGGVTGGEATTGGVTAHPMMVLSIPRPRHITHRRETIGRTPFVGQFT